MKSRILLLLAIAVVLRAPLSAESEDGAPVSSFSEAYLDTLLAPLALHPDPLVALILPAATVPTDIVLAARFLRAGGSSQEATAKDWDESVKALTQYPEVVDWLDKELAWTAEVGHAFLADPAGVMNAIQRLRARARATGALSSTHQQRVLVEEQIISILPASTRVIHVPVYDPAVVYVARPAYAFPIFLRFGFGHPIGKGLRYDCDWRNRRIWRFAHAHRPGDDWRRRRDDFCREPREPRRGHEWRPGRGANDRTHVRRSSGSTPRFPEETHRRRDLASPRGTWANLPRRADIPPVSRRIAAPTPRIERERTPVRVHPQIPATRFETRDGLSRRLPAVRFNRDSGPRAHVRTIAPPPARPARPSPPQAAAPQAPRMEPAPSATARTRSPLVIRLNERGRSAREAHER